MNRKRIGIIAGSSPSSAINLWQEILKENRDFLKDAYNAKNIPELVIFTNPELEDSMNLEENYSTVWSVLEKTIKDITFHVDYFCVACATLNIFQDDIRAMGYDNIFISTIDALKEHLVASEIKDIAIIGNKSLLELGRFSAYKTFKNQFNIEVPENIQKVHDITKIIRQDGLNDEIISMEFENIINSLESKNVILGCNELQLKNPSRIDKNFINANKYLAKKIILKSFL